MYDKSKKLTNREILLLSSGFCMMLALLLIFNRPPFYDEDEYLQNVPLLKQHGLTDFFLLHLTGSAGPLYAIVHYVLEPFTRLETPQIRIVNVLLLSGIIFFISRTLKLLQFGPRTYALCIMAVPLTYAVSGLALTEIPAMFFLSAGICLIINATTTRRTFIQAALLVGVGGGCLSLAIVGRQPYLLLLAAIPILFLPYRSYRNLILLLITLVFSLALPCYIFYVWKGLVAPPDATLYNDIAAAGVSFRPEFLFLCLGYFAMITALISPAFYIAIRRKTLVLLLIPFAALAIINYKFKLIRMLPMESVIKNLLRSPVLVEYAECFFGTAIFSLGLFYIFTLFRQLHHASYQKHLAFYSLALVLVAVSCMKITWGFSTRYAAQAIPLLIPIGSYFYRNNRRNFLRYGAGIAIGLISYLSYLHL